MSIAVVIPIKNGGPLLIDVITRVLSQDNPPVQELVLVDSGSTDGTREQILSIADDDKRVQLIDIPPESFNHGTTRNAGIEATTADFIVLLTQDAMPADSHWLAALLAAITKEQDIAGAVGRQTPYPDAPLCVRREIISHFERLDKLPHIFRAVDLENADEFHRQAAHFFSNNNAIIRRSVWLKHPYPEASFGEDQRWAESILKNGYAKAYAHDAVVQHSHNFSLRETYSRNRTEAVYYKKHFGYKLVKRLVDLPRLLIDFMKADYTFIRTHPDEKTSVGKFIWSTLLNGARLLGMYAGGR